MTVSNAKIIKVATLMNKANQFEDRDSERDECKRALTEFQTAHSQLEPDEMMMVQLASKLMSGMSYRMTSDNPDSIRRGIALAQEIGATFDDSMDDPMLGPKPGITSIKFFPPSYPVQ